MKDKTFPYDFPRGRMGHSHIAVITVIEEEFEAAQRVLAAHTELPGSRYFVDRSIQDKQWRIVLTQCHARGNLACATATSNVIEDFRPQVIILLGVAGGLCDGTDGQSPREGIGYGDVVIADYVGYTEFIKIEGDRWLLRKHSVDHPSHVLTRDVAFCLKRQFNLSEATRDFKRPTNRALKIHTGEVVAGEKILGGYHDLMQARLLEPFDKALAVDMESQGIASRIFEMRDTFWYNPRYAVIRGISDLVGPANNNADRVGWKPFAANAAAVVAKEFISRLPAADERIAMSYDGQSQGFSLLSVIRKFARLPGSSSEP